MTSPPLALYRSPPSVNPPALSVTGFGRQRIAVHVRQRRLPCHAVVLVETGRGMLETEAAGRLAIEGPALFWLTPGGLHSYGPTEGESWEEQWALFEGPFASSLVRQRLISETAPHVALSNLREMLQLFAALRADFTDGSALALNSAAATLHRIVVQSARQADAATDTLAGARIEAAVSALAERAFREIDMQQLAAEFDMSPATFRRRFMAATGLSPKAFQLRLRIDHAKQLLTTSDFPIEAIAREIGIDDAFYFSRLFQNREGLAPSAFRSRYRRQ
ncbi:helix-turn-helix domain-containing protein [Rhizobium sp. OAE497]|uniref:helix-turn-helix domain-containing protein n=1 Tax=Rhizobium sp. OAE497 TaxID=2663796 RepID=UPI0018F4D264